MAITRRQRETVEKWQEWDREVVFDLMQLLANRQIFLRYKDLLDNNPELDKRGFIFHRWARDNFYTYVVMTFRRQVDQDKDVISLARLITALKNNPQDLSREWHRSLYPADTMWSRIADTTFNENAGMGAFFDPTIADKDLEILRTNTKKVTDFATLSIAHYSKKSGGHIKFYEIDECFETFEKMAKKYHLLLTATGGELEPILDDSWIDIFIDKK